MALGREGGAGVDEDGFAHLARAVAAEAVSILRQRGAPIRLRVVGNCPDGIAAMDGIDHLGIINKASDLPHFIETIRSVDLGCQLSRAELAGIAMMEFLRVGVPSQCQQ